MSRAVLQPLGMAHSTFAVPLPDSLVGRAAIGHATTREPLGTGRNYVETAAAGLWSTPTDLARFAIGVMDAHAGRSALIPTQLAREMLTLEQGNYGKGLAVEGAGASLRFYHGGRNHGYDSYITGFPATGDGAVVMINANDHSRLMWRIMEAIARKQGWTAYPMTSPEAGDGRPIPAEVLQAVSGEYELRNGRLVLRAESGRLRSYVAELPDEEFVSAGDRLVSTERAFSLKPLRNATGQVVALEVNDRGQVLHAPRAGSPAP
jgi:CubicO group peptidase (beta-lactamase class C family)